ncbi:phosphotransferase, partial [Anaerosporobacter sp.]|uniref:phosphotransferase n=1 Tax=Anaerosporobacter sp. TaxID=1872529 RepID=UPI00286F4374
MDSLNKKYNFIKHEKICTGMSGDVKYKVEDKNGRHYLLRVAEIGESELKQHEYNLMKVWNNAEIPMPEAIDFGCCNDGKNVYTLLEWVEGIEVQKVQKELDSKEQYRLGKESGNILSLIHNSMEQKISDEWYDKYFKVIDERIQAYIDEDEHFDGDSIILEYLKENKELIKNR